MGEKNSVLVFEAGKVLNFTEIACRYPGCWVEPRVHHELGKRSIYFKGPVEDFAKIKEELEAIEILPGNETEEITHFRMHLLPGDTLEESLEIIRDFHDSQVS